MLKTKWSAKTLI